MRKRTPPPRITAQTFYQYLRCPLQLWFEHHGTRKKGKLPEIRKLLMEQGMEAERRIMRSLGVPMTAVAHDDEDEAFADTLRLLRAGTARIAQGTLIDGSWVGRPDLLVRKRGRSRLGAFHYAPMDVKLANELSDEHRFQLTFYALLLERIQGVRPRYAFVVNGLGKTLRFDVDEFLDRFHLTLGAIERILAGEKPAPFLSGSCKDSPWFDACRNEAVSCDDLSLVYKIWRTEYETLRRAGIVTIRDMATADLDALRGRAAGISRSRLERLQKQAIAYREERHEVLSVPDLPAASVEVYYDVETDMLAKPVIHYLHGALLVRKTARGETSRFVPFLVRNPKKEGEAWKRFCAFVMKLPKDAVIYHYGRYEHEVIAELTDRHGAPRAALERLADMIDLSRVATRSVIFPTLFASLKDLAKYLGFRWRHSEASGVNSIAWYKEWRHGRTPAIRRKMLTDILEYNEDDVRATKVLKDFLAGLETTT